MTLRRPSMLWKNALAKLNKMFTMNRTRLMERRYRKESLQTIWSVCVCAHLGQLYFKQGQACKGHMFFSGACCVCLVCNVKGQNAKSRLTISIGSCQEHPWQPTIDNMLYIGVCLCACVFSVYMHTNHDCQDMHTHTWSPTLTWTLKMPCLSSACASQIYTQAPCKSAMQKSPCPQQTQHVSPRRVTLQ